MPIYDFRCKKCNFEFDDFLKSHEDLNPNCPDCGGETTKLMSMFSCNVVGTKHRSLDSLIGEDAERRWKFVHNRRDKRLKKQKEQKQCSTLSQEK
jgi:putative FmdB family regulatory protein